MAFTLLELMICVAIIAILTSVSIVTYRRHIDSQEHDQCKANLVNLSQGIEAYKLRNGFYFYNSGSPHSETSYTIGSTAGASKFGEEWKQLPPMKCPTGEKDGVSADYSLRTCADGYTIRCSHGHTIHGYSTPVYPQYSSHVGRVIDDTAVKTAAAK